MIADMAAHLRHMADIATRLAETANLPNLYYPREMWVEELVHETPIEPGAPQPGRDCIACPADRDEHTTWGAVRTGCKLSIALVTGRSLYGRTS